MPDSAAVGGERWPWTLESGLSSELLGPYRSRMSTRSLPSAIVVMGALTALLAGCSPAPAPDTSEPTVQPESSTAPAAPCDPEAVTLSVLPDDGAALFHLAFTNNAANYCSLMGAPVVQAIDATGVPIGPAGTTAVDDPSAADAVEINPGEQAYSLVTFRGEEGTDCTPLDIAGLKVTLESGSEFSVGDLALRAYECADGAPVLTAHAVAADQQQPSE